MALLLPLLIVLLLATGDQAVAADEPSTPSHHTVPEPPPAPKGYQSPGGPPAATSASGNRHREIKIGPCFPNRGGGNALSDRGNAPSYIKRCTSKGYAGGRCDTVSGGLPGDCFYVMLDDRA